MSGVQVLQGALQLIFQINVKFAENHFQKLLNHTSLNMTPNEAKDIKDTEKRLLNSDSNVSNFFKSTKAELEKIVWPSRQQLISESAAVILMVVVSAGLVFLVDSIFGWISSRIFV
jgi:preprotein translocase subunit SecE